MNGAYSQHQVSQRRDRTPFTEIDLEARLVQTCTYAGFVDGPHIFMDALVQLVHAHMHVYLKNHRDGLH